MPGYGASLRVKPSQIALALLLMALLLFLQAGAARPAAAAASAPRLSPGDVGWKGGFTTNGTGKSAAAVAVDGSKVYIGGYFPAAGNVLANNIVQWDGSTWSTLGSGVNRAVYALAVDGRGHLYAGGNFTEAGGKPTGNIARWDGQAWEALGGGIYGSNGTSTLVLAIAVDAAGNVYAGGDFDRAGGVEVHNIARWDGQRWQALGSGIVEGTVTGLSFDGSGRLWVAGGFDQVGGEVSRNLAIWKEPSFAWLPFTGR